MRANLTHKRGDVVGMWNFEKNALKPSNFTLSNSAQLISKAVLYLVI